MHHSLCSFVRASLAAFSLLIVSSTVTAQPETGGRILGHVHDPDGQPVPGATIVVDGPMAAPRRYANRSRSAASTTCWNLRGPDAAT